MNKIMLTLVAINLLLNSCSDSVNDLSNKHIEASIYNELQPEEESEVIKLNNGEKWKVDANMLNHIRHMENDVVSFAKEVQKDYKSLSDKLQSNIDLLTSNCTMKGKAHDKLHKWLLPYIDMIEELSEAKDETEALEKFEKIQNSFTTFNQYFQ